MSDLQVYNAGTGRRMDPVRDRSEDEVASMDARYAVLFYHDGGRRVRCYVGVHTTAEERAVIKYKADAGTEPVYAFEDAVRATFESRGWELTTDEGHSDSVFGDFSAFDPTRGDDGVSPDEPIRSNDGRRSLSDDALRDTFENGSSRLGVQVPTLRSAVAVVCRLNECIDDLPIAIVRSSVPPHLDRNTVIVSLTPKIDSARVDGSLPLTADQRISVVSTETGEPVTGPVDSYRPEGVDADPRLGYDEESFWLECPIETSDSGITRVEITHAVSNGDSALGQLSRILQEKPCFRAAFEGDQSVLGPLLAWEGPGSRRDASVYDDRGNVLSDTKIKRILRECVGNSGPELVAPDPATAINLLVRLREDVGVDAAEIVPSERSESNDDEVVAIAVIPGVNQPELQVCLPGKRGHSDPGTEASNEDEAVSFPDSGAGTGRRGIAAEEHDRGSQKPSSNGIHRDKTAVPPTTSDEQERNTDTGGSIDGGRDAILIEADSDQNHSVTIPPRMDVKNSGYVSADRYGTSLETGTNGEFEVTFDYPDLTNVGQAYRYPMVHHGVVHVLIPNENRPRIECFSDQYDDDRRSVHIDIPSQMQAPPVVAAGKLIAVGTDGTIHTINHDYIRSCVEGYTDSIKRGDEGYDVVPLPDGWLGDARPLAPSFVQSETTLVVPTSSSDVHFVDLEGGVVRTTRSVTDSETALSQPPAVADDHVFVGTQDGMVCAYDVSSGTNEWSERLDDGSKFPTPPVVSGNKILMTSFKNNVYCLSSSNGQQEWKSKGSENTYCKTYPAVDSQCVVTCGAKQDGRYRKAYAQVLDLRDGSQQWDVDYIEDKRRDMGINVPPVIIGESVVFLDKKGHIYAFEMNEPTLLYHTDIKAPHSDGLPTIGVGSGNLYYSTGAGLIRVQIPSR